MGKSVVKAEPQAEAEQSEPVAASAAIMLVIERAAANPNVDIDKMERLLQMQERVLAKNAEAAFAEALAAMQPELPIIAERGGIRDRSDRIQSRYALWEDIVASITPILSKHGFALTFRTATEGDKVRVTGVLTHRGGHNERTDLTLPFDNSGNKNAVQSVGSSTSYGKRYTASALLNLRTGEVDDDGRAGGSEPRLTEEQIANIEALISEVGADRARFLKYLKVDSLDEILARNYETVVKMLEAKRSR